MLQLADRPKMLGNTEVIGTTMVSVQKSTGNQVFPFDWFEMGSWWPDRFHPLDGSLKGLRCWYYR
jgi:hypothetical protein